MRALVVALAIAAATSTAGFQPATGGGAGSKPAVREGDISWRELQPGVELATLATPSTPYARSSGLTVVRVDPGRAKLRMALASESKREPQTAREWCRTEKLAVAINAGMFQHDHRSNVGYLRHGRHLNHKRWNSYRAAVGITAAKPALWLDLDASKDRAALDAYDIVVQNLRLIAGKRRNVWAKSDKRWSEAALAIDSRGRLLFLFSRAPYTMRDFNDLLLKLPLDVTQAMHLEGGPEASLSVHVPGTELDLSGSYETGFSEHDGNDHQWPIPNVLGVVRE